MSTDDRNETAGGTFDTRTQWQSRLREALLGLEGAAAREAVLVDAVFDDWPLSDAAVVDALTRWLKLPGRRLRLIGLNFEGMQASQARFAAWRRNWTHAIEVVSPLEVEVSDMPSLLTTPAPPLAIERLDRERFRGRATSDPRDVRLVTERVAALLQRCEPSWPANALGL